MLQSCMLCVITPELVIAIWRGLSCPIFKISPKCWPSVLPTWRRCMGGVRHSCHGCLVTSCNLLRLWNSDKLWTRWKTLPTVHILIFYSKNGSNNGINLSFLYSFFEATFIGLLCCAAEARGRTVCANVYQCSLIRSEALTEASLCF